MTTNNAQFDYRISHRVRPMNPLLFQFPSCQAGPSLAACSHCRCTRTHCTGTPCLACPSTSLYDDTLGLDFVPSISWTKATLKLQIQLDSTGPIIIIKDQAKITTTRKVRMSRTTAMMTTRTMTRRRTRMMMTKWKDDEHDRRAQFGHVNQSCSWVSLNLITIVSKYQDHLANEIKSSRQ